jgi:hypothetical protein
MSTIRTLTPPSERIRSKVEGILSAIAVEPVRLSVQSSGTFTFDNARKRALRAQNVGSDVQTIPEELTAPRGSPQNPPVLAQMRIAAIQKAQNEELAKNGVSKETNLNANDLNAIQQQSKPSNSTSTLGPNTKPPATETNEERKRESTAREEEVRQRPIEMEKEREERKQEKEGRNLEKEREKEREELARERAGREVELQEKAERA